MLRFWKNMGSANGTKYSQWAKEELIERIEGLEKLLQQNSKKRPSPWPAKDLATSPKKRPSPWPAKDLATSPKKFNFGKHSTRFIALKFQYLGWGYNGLALQAHDTEYPTVEETIFKAMETCKLIPGHHDLPGIQYSRCGRTDKGVSAYNQVISLRVRSALTAAEQQLEAHDGQELQYGRMLNKLLPSDIRIKAVSLRPPEGFDSRFSCKARHYKYVFSGQGLDVAKMKQAAEQYAGDHDFRNFCKIDGSKQITNFHRTIRSLSIVAVQDLYVFDLVGSAFLWHQVRCMVAVLFLIGKGHEDVSIIGDLFDVVKYPSRPVYDMADDLPLVLYDCEFADVHWTAVEHDDYEIWLKNRIETFIIGGAYSGRNQHASDPGWINTGDGTGKRTRQYRRLEERTRLKTADEANAKFKLRKRQMKQSQP